MHARPKIKDMRNRATHPVNTGLLIAALLFTTACAYKSYEYDSLQTFEPVERAISQTIEEVTVQAFVPSPEEAERLFGFPVYDRGIQPVWLRISNDSGSRVRFAPTSLDEFYFSPLEVSYIHRKGYSKEARREMDIRLHRLAMPRIIPAGEQRSGFVFTHASEGTKSFNVDVFGLDEHFRSFHFLTEIKGFTPDHAHVDFTGLYSEDNIRRMDEDNFRDALAHIPCCSVNAADTAQGLPVSALIIGRGRTLLSTLLRAGWNETTMDLRDTGEATAQFLFNRPADSVFRFRRANGQVRNELRLWLTPVTLDGVPIWAAQVIQFIGHRTQLQDLIFGSVFDPDMDSARSFLLQNLWYNQGVRQIAWQQAKASSTFDAARKDFNDTEYFTDGVRSIIWLSENPMAMNQVDILDWKDRVESK